MMMDGMMPGMMWAMGLVWLLVIIVLVLAAAALVGLETVLGGVVAGGVVGVAAPPEQPAMSNPSASSAR